MLTHRRSSLEPWGQLHNEPDADFEHFCYWRELVPRPPPLDLALAVRFNWDARAAAWESYQAIKGLTPKEMAQQVLAMWSLTITNETRKWLAKSLREQAEPSLMPQSIGDFIELITDPARNQAARPSHDFSTLAPDEKTQLLALLQKAKTQ